MNSIPSAANIQADTTPFVGTAHVTVISATNIAFVGKRYRLIDAKLDKKTDGQIATGSAITIPVEGPQELADLIEALKPNDALSLGCLNAGIGVRKTLNTRAAASGTEISRSLDHFSHPVGQGWLLLDCDLGEAPDSVRRRIAELGGITKAVAHIWPDLKKAACVIRHSSSAGIVLPDGTPTEAKDSRHIFVMIEDVSQSAEVLKKLSQRAWAEGLGWVSLSKSGSRLNYSIIDTSVGSPERMVFEVPPVLYDGLTRKAPPTYVQPGIALPAPEAPAGDQHQLALEEAMAAIAPEAEQAEEAHKQDMAAKLARKSKIPLEDARRKVEKRLGDQVLDDDDWLESPAGDVRVGNLLDNPPRTPTPFADPVEGLAYGSSTAYFLPADKTHKYPKLVSHAHGHRTVYRFARFSRKHTDTAPHPPRLEHHVPVDDGDAASQKASEAVEAFLRDAVRPDLPAPPARLIRADLGVGKTRALVNAVARFCQHNLEHRILVRVPTHKLADQIENDLRQAGLESVGVYRGMGQPALNPGQPGDTMCLRLDDFETVRAAGGTVGRLCGSVKRGFCPHHPLHGKDRPCDWHGQSLKKAQVVIVAGDVSLTKALPGKITRSRPKVTPIEGPTLDDFNLVLIDETAPVELVRFGDGDYSVAVGLLDAAGSLAKGFAGDMDDITFAEMRDGLSRVRRMLESVAAQGRTWPTKADAEAHDVVPGLCTTLRGIVWWFAPDVTFDPALDTGERLEARLKAAAQRYRDVRAVVHVLTALEQGLEDAPDGGMMQIRVHRSGGRGGSQLMAGVCYRSKIADAIAKQPTLILDGTPQIDLLRKWWPTLREACDARAVDGPGTFRLQVVGDAWTYSSSVPKGAGNGKGDAAAIDRIRRAVLWSVMTGAVAGGQAGFIAPMKAVEAAEARGWTKGLLTAHYGVVRGLNRFEQAGSLVVYSRQLPNTRVIERLAGVVNGAAPSPALGDKPLEKRAGELLMRDGQAVSTLEVRHPDPAADLIVETTCRAERQQAAERGRSVRRQADRPLVATLLGDGDTGRPVDYVASFDEWQAATSWVGGLLASGVWITGRGRAEAIGHVVRQWPPERFALDNGTSEGNDGIALEKYASEQNDGIALDKYASEGNEGIALDKYASEDGEKIALDKYASEKSSKAYITNSILLEKYAFERLTANPSRFWKDETRNHPAIGRLINRIDAAMEAGAPHVLILGVKFSLVGWIRVEIKIPGKRYGLTVFNGPGFGFGVDERGERI